MTVFLDAGRASRSSAAPTSRPSRATGCRASARCCVAVAEAYRDRRGDVDAAGRGARRARSASAARLAPSTRAAHRRRCSAEAVAQLRAQLRPASMAASAARPKFPPASTLEFLLREALGEALEMARGTLDGMAAGGMYDLVGGGFHRYSVDAHLARPALREDALRQRAARPAYLHAWVAHRRGALPAGRRGDARLHAARAAAPRRRLRLGAGRRHRRRRGPDLHVDGGRARGGARRAARDCSSRSSTAAPSCAASSTGDGARRAARGARRRGRSRRATTRRSPPGTGSRSRRSPRPGAGSTAPTTSTRARARGVPARAALAATGGC